jgi:hypothetical protein
LAAPDNGLFVPTSPAVTKLLIGAPSCNAKALLEKPFWHFLIR